ncbi:MAG TPA: hypothetical protein VMU30_05340 [Bacteroidota bacterium]|nr:hypothetical protein [Bacteroidota bacterium]
MPFTYRIEAGGSIAHVTGVGQGDVDSAHSTFSELLNDKNIHRPFGLLIDVRALHNLPNREETADIAMFARVDAEHYTALVVQRGVQFGMARMIQMLAELQGARIKIFTDDLMAQLWLRNQLNRLQ